MRRDNDPRAVQSFGSARPQTHPDIHWAQKWDHFLDGQTPLNRGLALPDADVVNFHLLPVTGLLIVIDWDTVYLSLIRDIDAVCT
jgi:hypothetical protein